MAKVAQLKWTNLQREIAALAHQGKTFDELIEMGYTKSLVSKVLNAIKSGQKPSEYGEPRTENREPMKFAAQTSRQTNVLAQATTLAFTPRVFHTTYTPIMRAAQEAAVEFWGWPADMSLEDFLDTALHLLFKEHGITLAGYTISDEAREALESELKEWEEQKEREEGEPQRRKVQ